MAPESDMTPGEIARTLARMEIAQRELGDDLRAGLANVATWDAVNDRLRLQKAQHDKDLATSQERISAQLQEVESDIRSIHSAGKWLLGIVAGSIVMAILSLVMTPIPGVGP